MMEKSIELRLSRPLVNLLTALMPTLEGLFLATVLDGRKGRVLLWFSSESTAEIEYLCRDMSARYPGEWVGAPPC